jgi:hypothetical protein
MVSAIVEFAYGDLAASRYRVGKPMQREFTGPSVLGAPRTELCIKSTHHLDHSHVEGRFIAVTSTGGVLKAF